MLIFGVAINYGAYVRYMDNKPLVSILINNYNYERFIGKAIDSALDQTYPHTEVIVVDDGSTDNSRGIITSYKEQIIPVLKQNGGQASAFNEGFAMSKGEIICFLDSDDFFVPEKVAKVVSVFSSYPDIGWCFHRLKLVDANTGELIRLSRHQESSRQYDCRSDIRSGKLSFSGSGPATSGLCFTRPLLEQILPMFESEASAAADRYIKYVTMALSKGFFLNEPLTLQQIHGKNALSNMEGKQQFIARERTLAAFHIRAKLPELASLTNKLFARGLGLYWQTRTLEAKDEKLIAKYLSTVSTPERLKIYLMAFYHFLRS